MPISAAKLSVDVDANTSEAERKLKGMGNTVEGSSSGFGVMGNAAKALGGALVLAGGSGLTMGLKTASGLEQADIAFTTMLGSGKKADAFLGDLKKFAAQTPFEFPELVSASQKLLAMGFSAKEVRPTLTAIGDTVAGLGGGAEMVDRVTMAFGQMQAKGKVSSEELLQMTEAGIPALKILADGFGVTTGEMQEMVTKGKVMSDKAIPLLVKGLNEGTKSTAGFGGMMSKQSKTMAGSWSTFMDTLQMGLADAVQPLLPVIADALPKAATAVGAALKTVVPVFSDLVKGVMSFVGAWTGASKGVESSGFGGTMANLARAVKPLLSGFMSVAKVVAGVFLVALKALGAILGPLLSAMAKHPGVMRAIGAAIAIVLVPALLVAIQTWAAAKIAAMQAGMASLKASAMTVKGWVMSGAAAVRSGAQTATVWMMYRIESAKAAAAMVAAKVRIVAAWVAMQVKAMASAIQMKAAWLVGIISQGAKAAAAMALTAARVVAGWVLMGVQAMLGAAKMALAWLIAMGPIVLVIAAVVGLAVLIYKNWDKIVAWTKAAWTAVVTWLKTAWTNIKATAAAGVQWVVTKVQTVWAGLKGIVSGIWNGIKATILTVWNGIKAVVSGAVNAVKATISAVFRGIVAVVRLYVNTWKTIITTAWNLIKSVVSGAVNAVKSVISRVFNAVKSLITRSLNGWKTIITTTWNLIKSVVTTAVNAVKSIISRVFSAISSLVTRSLNGWKRIITTTWNAIKSVVTSAVNGVKSTVTSAFNTVKSTIQSAMNTAKSVVTSAWNGIKTAVSNATNGVMDTVRGIPGRITGALSNLGSLLFNSGKSIIQGLVNGIKNMASAPANAMKDVISKARDYLPFSPAKKGPFSGKGWTLYSGRSISTALAKGIMDRSGKVSDASSALAEAAAFKPSDAMKKVALGTPTGAFRRQVPSSLQYGATSSATDAGARPAPPASTMPGPGGGPSFTFNTYNPVEEPQSVTVNKAMARVAALPVV